METEILRVRGLSKSIVESSADSSKGGPHSPPPEHAVKMPHRTKIPPIILDFILPPPQIRFANSELEFASKMICDFAVL
jgi:hypothetical protein